MPSVTLYGNLRRYTQPQLQIDATTVRALIEQLEPDLRAMIWENDTLRPFIRILINGKDIELMNGLDATIAENDHLSIFPPIAGGTE